MARLPRLFAAFLAVSAAGTASGAHADGLFEGDGSSLLRAGTFAGESVSGEAFAGYLRTTATEYVYGGNAKLSRLDWSSDGLAVGGRVAVRPLDWLSVRGRGWTTVTDDGSMRDYDWFAGYAGPNSYTHRSRSPDTGLSRSWLADGSIAAAFWQEPGLTLTGIVGFRHYEADWQASGGTYVYSTDALFDTLGTLPNRVGISYHQQWDTPYGGFGVAVSSADWTMTTELIGSPFVMASDRDTHHLRDLVFTANYRQSGMLGANAGLEYRVSPLLSMTGRVEYQKYFDAKGATKVHDLAAGTVAFYPKPSAGADSETLLLSLGVKARL